MKNTTIIGILGGLGPEATASLFKKIIKETEVKKDQEHYRVIIDSNPKIPDRTEAILYGGDSPAPKMIETANNLVSGGADIILVPCMTSFYFMKEVQAEVNAPIMNVFEVLDEFLKAQYPHVKKVGVLATTGTRKSELFTQELSDHQIIYPDEHSQEDEVMSAIYCENGIKQGNTGGHPQNLLKRAAEKLIEKGAEVIIAGCTEIELALKQEDVSKPLIDPMLIAAKKVTEMD